MIEGRMCFAVEELSKFSLIGWIVSDYLSTTLRQKETLSCMLFQLSLSISWLIREHLVWLFVDVHAPFSSVTRK